MGYWEMENFATRATGKIAFKSFLFKYFTILLSLKKVLNTEYIPKKCILDFLGNQKNILFRFSK